MFSISVLGCCRLGRIIPFNLAYLRMCMLHYVFFFVLFTVEIDLFFLFVFVVGIPLNHLTYPAQLFFCFSHFLLSYFFVSRKIDPAFS